MDRIPTRELGEVNYTEYPREWQAVGVLVALFIIGMTVEQSTLDNFECLIPLLSLAFAWWINSNKER